MTAKEKKKCSRSLKRSLRVYASSLCYVVVASLLFASMIALSGVKRRNDLSEDFLSDGECRERNRLRLERLARVCRTSPKAAAYRLDSDAVFPKPKQFRANARRKVAVCAAHKCGSESWR